MNVYDFDNTIYDGESTFDLFRFYIKKDPSLLKLFPTVFAAFARYKKGDVTIEEIIAKYVPMVEERLMKIDFDKDPKEFWDNHMHKIKPFYNDLKKDDDLLITASPDFNIEEICRRIGIKNILATKVNKETGKIEFVCIRQNKIEAFKDLYGDADIENFYTDSPENDAPLIELAKHAFIVKKDVITQVK